jgi:hypothetical protein
MKSIDDVMYATTVPAVVLYPVLTDKAFAAEVVKGTKSGITARYGLELLLDPNGPDLAAMLNIVAGMAQDAFGLSKVTKGNLLKADSKFLYPFRDGTMLADARTEKIANGGKLGSQEFYRGLIRFKATSTEKFVPEVSDKDNRIADPAIIYGGCSVLVYVKFKPFSKAGKEGVSAYLNKVKFIRDGVKLGGGSGKTAAEVFGGSSSEDPRGGEDN